MKFIRQMVRTAYLEQSVKLDERFEMLHKNIEQTVAAYVVSETKKQDEFRKAVLDHNAQIESGLGTLVDLVKFLVGKKEKD